MQDTFLLSVRRIYGDCAEVMGPYIWKKNGRKIVDVKIHNTKKTMLMARLVLEVKLGRRLSSEETVDHIDEDPLNDEPENLQVLTLKENARKSADATRVVNWVKDISNRELMVENASGTSNGMSKLNAEQIKDLRSRSRYHGCFKEWASEFGVTPATISDAFKGKTYRS